MAELIPGKNVGLRGLARGDMEQFWRWINNLEMYALALPVLPYSQEMAEHEYKRGWSSEYNRGMVIIRHEDDKLVGLIRVYEFSHRLQAAKVNVAIEPQYRRQGYGADAAFTVIGHLFSQCNIVRVAAFTRARDEAACGLVSKVGLQRDGVLRKHCFRDNEYQDVLIHSILVDEYPLDDYLSRWADHV